MKCLRVVLLTPGLWFGAIGIAASAEQVFDFETGGPAFQMTEGKGRITLEKAKPLHGTASLRIDVDPQSPSVKAVSPSFAIDPFEIYAIEWTPRTDVGTDVWVSLIFQTLGRQYEYRATRIDGNHRLAATFPDVKSAKLAITVTIPGKTLGRTVVLDDIRVTPVGRLKAEASGNLMFNGSFETPEAFPPPLWEFWGQPGVYAPCRDNPKEGNLCLEVTKAGIVVPPVMAVKPYCLYHLTYWVRGKGTIYPGLHKLSLDARIGWAAALQKEVVLDARKWQLVEFVTACESPAVDSFNPYFGFRGEVLYIDDVRVNKIKGH